MRKHELARDKNTPPALLAMLARDEWQHVRAQTARNKNATAAILAALVHDADWYVRQAIAKNQHAPPAILAALANDDNANVQAAAKANRRRAIVKRKIFVISKNSLTPISQYAIYTS